MRITKVKVEAGENGNPGSDKGKMVFLQREVKKGSLVLEGFSSGASEIEGDHLSDRTTDIIQQYKNRSFGLSLLKQTVISKDKLQKVHCEKCKGKKPCEACKKKYEHKKVICSTLERIFKPVIEDVIYGKRIDYDYENIKFSSQLSLCKEELSNFLCHKFRDTLRYNDVLKVRREVNLIDCLGKFIDSKGRMESLRAYCDWAEAYIVRKKAMLEKSVQNNRIVFDYSETETTGLSKRKQALLKWGKDYEDKSRSNQGAISPVDAASSVHYNINLDDFHRAFKIDDLCNAFALTLEKQLALLKEQEEQKHKQPNLQNTYSAHNQLTETKTKLVLTSSVCALLKKTLQEHQATWVFGRQADLEKENVDPARDAFIKHRNDCQLYAYNLEVVKYLEHYFPIKRKKPLPDEESARYYLNPETIKKRIQFQLENAVRMQLLQQGKLKHHELDEKVNSETLSSIKRDDFFVLNLVEACAFAASNIRNIIDHEQERDILGKDDFKESLESVCFDEELCKYFYDTNLKTDCQAIWAMRGAVQQIRNGIIHHHKGLIDRIFKLDTFEYENAVDSEKQYTHTVFKELLQKSLAKLDGYIVEQFRSNDVLSYYEASDLNKLFGEQSLSLHRHSIPFAPGFKNIYDSGAKLQQGSTGMRLNHFLLAENNEASLTREGKELSFSRKLSPAATKLSPAYPAFRFLLKLIYNHLFLNFFLNSEDNASFRNAVAFVLKNNREEAMQALRESAKKHPGSRSSKPLLPQKYAFREIRGVQNGEDIASYMSYLHSFSVQEQERKGDGNENGETVRRNTEKFLKQVFVKGFDTYLSRLPLHFLYTPNIEKVQEDKDHYVDLDIKVKHQIDCTKGAHISFFAFCKLLDGNHLSDLRNELLKYSATSKAMGSSVEYNFAFDVIELCLLDNDKRMEFDKEGQVVNSDTKSKLCKGTYKKLLAPFVKGDEKTNRIWMAFYFQSDKETPVDYGSLALIRKFSTQKLLEALITDEYKVTEQDYDEWVALKRDIDKKVQEREQLHAEWVEAGGKFVSESNTDVYFKLCKDIERYNWLDNKLHLVHLKQLHNFIIQILSRMARFVAMRDRDLAFVKELRFPAYHKSFFMQDDTLKECRNYIAHFNYVTTTASSSLIDILNSLRELMAYDRKLRNAVTKSIIHVFKQNGMNLQLGWVDNGRKSDSIHRLMVKSVKSEPIKLLKAELTIDQVPEEYCRLCKWLLEMKK